jgi:hypothetical protein
VTSRDHERPARLGTSSTWAGGRVTNKQQTTERNRQHRNHSSKQIIERAIEKQANRSDSKLSNLALYQASGSAIEDFNKQRFQQAHIEDFNKQRI